MKTNRLFVLCLAGALLLTSVSFTSCLKGDDVETNQYTGEISLNVFGPSPVARGGELRFLGSGMNQVTAVVIPGCEDITDIKVISDTEIRITVPQEAEPGLVTLKTPAGDITTKTKLTFTEPISIESFTPVAVFPGDELTIEGEYLNLMHEVIFADEVVVSEENFITHDRNMIKLIVPEEAQSGQIILSNGAEMPNMIYSEEELQVVLPSVASVVTKEKATPGDVMIVNGENLSLVRKVVVPSDIEVEFRLNTDKTQLEFVLPDNTSDGDIVVMPASGAKVVVAQISMAVPEDLVVVPASDIRGGDEIILSGKYLDVVTGVSFPGVNDIVLPVSQAEDQLKIVMPQMAQSGDLVLHTKSGKQVNVAIETLKPQIDSYAPSSVPAGDNLVISGQNLDLVASITFGGGLEGEILSTSSQQLTVQVPVKAETGNVILNMNNGEKVEGPLLSVLKPLCCYAVELPDKAEVGTVLDVEVVNGDKLTAVKVNGSEVQFILQETKLLISLPSDGVGQGQIELISSNGSISYSVEFIGSLGTLIFQGPFDIISWNAQQLSSDLFETAQVGQIITVVVSNLQSGAQGSFKNGNWAAIAPGMEYFDINGNFSLTITQEILSQLQSGGLIISGHSYTIDSVYIK